MRNRQKTRGRLTVEIARQTIFCCYQLHRTPGAGNSNSRTRWKKAHWSASAAANFLPGQHLSVLRDITERKKIELEQVQARNELVQSQKRYREVIENANDLIFTSDLNGNITTANTAVEQILGYTSEEIVKLNIIELIVEDQIEMVRGYITAKKNGLDHTRYEVSVKTKVGRIIDLEVNSRIIYENGVQAEIQAIARDITERKHALKWIREADRRAIDEYARLLKRISKLAEAFGTARDLRTVYQALNAFTLDSTPCSGIIVSLFDLKQGKIIPSYLWLNGEEIAADSLTPMPLEGDSSGKAVFSEEPFFYFGNENGLPAPQSSLAVPMNIMGNVMGTIEIQSTEKSAFKKEHVTAMQMAANLTAKAVENIRLYEQERQMDEHLRQVQKLESVGLLTGGIAHDFNNMLTAINGYSELSLRELGHHNPLRRNIEEIQKAGARAASLTLNSFWLSAASRFWSRKLWI